MTTELRRRGPYAAGKARRAQILETAKEHFAREGYVGASIAQIAAAVGLTETGLKHHFASKDELLLEVLAAAEQDSAQVAETLLQGSASMGELWDILVSLAEHNSARPGLVRLSVTLAAEAISPDHPAHEWMKNRLTTVRKVTTTVLQQGISAGEVDPKLNCDVIARETVAVLDGLQLQWILGQQDFDMVASVKDYVRRMAKAVRPDGPGARGMAST